MCFCLTLWIPEERLDSDIDQLLTRKYDGIVYILPTVRPECTGRGCINRHGFLSASVRTSHPHTIPSSENIFRTEHSSDIKHSYYCSWQSSKPLQAGLNRFGRPGNYGVYTLCWKHRHNLLWIVSCTYLFNQHTHAKSLQPGMVTSYTEYQSPTECLAKAGHP